jgi:hypothetical protein
MDGRRARIVLGVGNDAGPVEIRRAFRARAPRFDAYDSRRRPAPTRSFADVLQAATAGLV